jgi:hypothetical protein
MLHQGMDPNEIAQQHGMITGNSVKETVIVEEVEDK